MDTQGITDDLLELILLRIHSPIYLLRAASTCRRLYRIIARSGFLNNFYSIHGPPLAYGYYNGKEEFPRPDFDSSYFCLSFLPDISSRSMHWEPKDRRASLVLLERFHCTGRFYQDWVVCEHLSRRYEIIPPLPLSVGSYRHTWAFLLDGANGIDILNFRVFCAVWTDPGYRPYMFSSGRSWHEICINSLSQPMHLSLIGFAAGSVYWHAGDNTLFAVNRSTTKFVYFLFPCVRDLDDYVNRSKVTVITGRDGEARIVVGADHGGSMDIFARQRGSGEWVLEKRIHIDLSDKIHGLPRHNGWFFYCPTPISLHRAGTVIIRLKPDSSAGDWRIDLNRKTVTLLDCVPQIRCPCKMPWPPVLRDY